MKSPRSTRGPTIIRTKTYAKHITFNGDYIWPTEPLQHGFRPLRNLRSAFLRAAPGIKTGSIVTAAWMIQSVEEDTDQPGSDLFRTRFMSRCRTVIYGQDD